ncbi:MAG: hypothetical protein RBR87_10410 [Bacteroidales bacterium]|jgi:hypothetical protein|nr:hypothetical protein [Bacteroidales bacterium]
MNPKVSSTNTKAQILKAYEEVLKKLEEKSEAKPKEVQQRKEAILTVESAQKNTDEKIIADITAIKNSFVESLEKVQESLSNEYDKLAEIQAAIKIEKKNLEDLYGLSTNADSFAAILLAQKESQHRFDEEMKSKKESLDAEIANTKLRWDKEKAEKEALDKEEKLLLEKTRTREEEEYNYNLQQKRKKETDEYQLIKSQQEAELREKRIAFEKEFAEREKSIVETETEYAALKKAAEQFPKELEKAIQNAQADLEKSLTTQFKYEKNLIAKETEGLIKLKDLQVSSLESKIKEMEERIKELGQKADTSEKSLKDIALKAIERSTKVHVVEKEKTE